MKKELLFFVVLSFILLIECVESPPMGVGIASIINASLTVETGKPIYYQGQTVDINNTLENTGNTESIGNLTTRLFAPNGSEILREDWFDIPLEKTTLPKYYSTSYDFSSDADLGIYIVTSNFSYEGKIANANTEFEVKEMPLTTVPTVPTTPSTIPVGRQTTTTLPTTTTMPTIETTTLVTTTEETTTTIIVTMPAVVWMPCLIWIIIVIVIDSIVIVMAKKRRADWVNTILIITVISFFIALLVPDCLIWIILATLVMMTIATWMKTRERPRRRRKLPKIKKW